MEDRIHQFWEEKLSAYNTTDWIDKPSIFVQEAIKYFPSSGKVLELAGGQGQDSRFLSQNGYEVTCTDRSDFGLEEAQRKTEREGLNIHFMKVDLAEPLPFSEGQFDVVYAHMGLHYFTQEYTKELFKEIHRVLKSNGIFAGIFNTSKDPEIIENGLEKVENNYYYEKETGLKKRYFSIEETEGYIHGLFEVIILDDNGRTYKDDDLGLVRLIACKF
jgi:ubiquinone/menaquinone biosynthesis C-methylase UbiE